MKLRPLTSLTFRAQLSLFAGVLLLPLAGLMGWQVYNEFQGYLASARQSSLNLARLAAAHIDEIVTDLDGTLRVLANRPQIQALDAARCDPMLREMPTIFQPYANLALARRDGTVICSAVPSPDNRPMSLAKMPWFADARDAPGLHVSDPFKGPYTGRLVMAFSYPIWDRERTIVGRVGLSVDVARFQSVLDSLTLPPDTVLALLSADGTLLARVPPLPAQIGTRASDTEIVQQARLSAEGVAQSRGADGNDRIYGFTSEPKTGWHVYASLPLKAALAPASRGALQAVLAFFAETGLLALFVGILYRWIGPSVRVLGGAADIVYGGGRAVLMPPIAPLELRQTADAFNSMLAARERAEDLAHGQKRVLEMIATGAPLEQTLEELAKIAEAQNPEMICTVLLLDADGQRLRHGAAPSLPEEYTSAIDGAAVAEGAGSCGTAAHRRQTVIVADIATDPLWADYRELALKHGLRSCWSTPIFDAQHQVLGTFAIYGRQPGRPTVQDLFLIETVTQSAAIAITSHREKAALHLSNERYQLAGRATNDVVWDWDLITGQLWWNRNFQTLFGYTPEQIEPGLESWTHRLHSHDEARVKEGIYRVIDGGGTSWTDEYRFRRSDGSYADVLDRGYVIRDAVGKAVRMIGAMMDITERKSQQLKIVKLSRTHAVLSAIGNLIVRARSRAELLQEACRMAVEQGLFPLAWIGLREGDEVRPVALHGDDGGYVKDVVISLRAGGVNSSGPAARALRTGQAAIVNDIDSEPTLARWHTALRALGYHAYVVYPLLVAGEVVGCLCLYAREPNFFDEAEVKLLGELVSDISYAMEFITREETLDNLAIYDPLTRLPNRALFVQRLEQFVKSAQESRSALAVIMLDVDRFKALNDLAGRAGGDDLLKKIGERLKRIAGGSKYIARVAGDRFAMVIPQLEDVSTLAATLEDSNWALLKAPYQLGDHELKVTLKLGIALFPDHGDDAESLLRNSEAALKHARSSGQRQVVYTRDMGVAVAERLRKEEQMRRALEREEFVLHYQPKVDLRSGAICGAEALIRWNSPDHGMVGPNEFIPLVEATGQIQDVGRWALQRAVKDYCSWVSQGAPATRVAVNVSQAQLLQPDFVETFKAVLAEARSKDTNLELEITESMLMTDVSASIEKLRILREQGVAIVMDDFGTGYSSLIALTQLPLSAIKIDRSFVADMLDNPDTKAIVSTIIALAHSMRLIVIAEGVETAGQLALLRQLGCDEMQGWLFSRALPADEYFQLLRSGRKLPLGLMPA